mmetsp:Transcript_46774/g.106738  ORF Transcript_46774/g.106738 Transcript_46774/m.106738 type:complete len:215 (+) Transcript_46774:2-646(+)
MHTNSIIPQVARGSQLGGIFRPQTARHLRDKTSEDRLQTTLQYPIWACDGPLRNLSFFSSGSIFRSSIARAVPPSIFSSSHTESSGSPRTAAPRRAPSPSPSTSGSSSRPFSFRRSASARRRRSIWCASSRLGMPPRMTSKWSMGTASISEKSPRIASCRSSASSSSSERCSQHMPVTKFAKSCIGSVGGLSLSAQRHLTIISACSAAGSAWWS